MNLYSLLGQHEIESRTRRVGLIGAGRCVTTTHVQAALNGDPRRQACDRRTCFDVRDAALTYSMPPSPWMLIAKGRTYRCQGTEQWPRSYAPEAPRKSITGRNVPVSLRLAEDALGFTAKIPLEDCRDHLLVDLGEVTQ